MQGIGTARAYTVSRNYNEAVSSSFFEKFTPSHLEEVDTCPE